MAILSEEKLEDLKKYLNELLIEAAAGAKHGEYSYAMFGELFQIS